VRDNSPAPPSVLVSELLDYVEQGYAPAPGAPSSCPARCDPEDCAEPELDAPTLSEQILTHHRLQAFNAEYFRPAGRLFSFSEENFAACVALRGGAAAGAFVPRVLPPPDASLRNVSVDQLINFFVNPSRFFTTQRLKLNLPRPKAAIADREPIEIDNLEAYDLKSAELECKLAGVPPDEAQRRLKASGRLPLGRIGEARHRELRDEAEAFHQRLQPFHPDRRLDPPVVDLALAGFRITGRLPAPTPAGLLLWRPATIKGKDLARAWVTHVLWQAVAGQSAGRTVLVGEAAKGRSAVAFTALPEAAGVLAGLLELYWRGLSEPLKFFPATSLAFVEAEPEAAESAARKAWTSDDHNRRDDSDEYFALCFPRVDPLDAEFAAIAREVLGPMLEHEEALE
jgi:exodeoxyribonuclease V gamma subunit